MSIRRSPGRPHVESFVIIPSPPRPPAPADRSPDTRPKGDVMSAPLLKWEGDRAQPNHGDPARESGRDPLRVLYLEDQPSDVELVQYELERAGLSIELRHVRTRA